MNKFLLLLILTGISLCSAAIPADSSNITPSSSVLIIPYKPAMHLSDADTDLSQGSEMEMPKMRETFRRGMIKALNRDFAEVFDTRMQSNDFVRGDNRDLDLLYHSIYYESDSVYPLKYPKHFTVKDSLPKKKETSKAKKEVKYINAGLHDKMLISDLSKKYNSDYIIFLNEIDIETHFEDCLNLALKIYRRDLKVHYTIFDKNGKQVYGDVAISHFASNSNDVNEIIEKNFPAISNYILTSLSKVAIVNSNRE